jgi:hypothetical protein
MSHLPGTDGEGVRRIPRVFGACVALACLLVGSGRAAPGLLVGTRARRGSGSTIASPASSSRGNNRLSLSAGASHSPVEFYRKLGEAYRASRCTAPIFDTIGHNPYPTTNAERPWTRYPGGTIAGGATTPG